MDIILLKDVENLGAADTVVTVKPGYARNYLIPQGMAIIANEANSKVLNSKIAKQEAEEARRREEFESIAKQISSKQLVILTKAGTSGKIFGSVSNIQVARAIMDEYGVDIERRKIVLEHDVKMLGAYSATINLSKEVQATVEFLVKDEDGKEIPVAEETPTVEEESAPAEEETVEETNTEEATEE